MVTEPDGRSGERQRVQASECGAMKCGADRCPPHLIGYTYSIPVRDGHAGRSVGERVSVGRVSVFGTGVRHT